MPEATLQVARSHVEAAAEAVLTVPDAALRTPWEWHGSKQSIRYALYRLHEVLEETQAELAGDAVWTPAGALAARCTAARWALHGAVLPYSDLLDAAAGGEWTLREVLSHVVNAQDFWDWLSGHWVDLLREGSAIPAAGYVRESVPDRYRAETPALEGSLTDIRRRLDEHLDASLSAVLEVERFGALDTPVTWQRAPVTIRFYPGRWSAHLREHTNQATKTVPLAGREVREVERILAIVLRAYGELEGTALRVPDAISGPALEAAARGVAEHAREIAATATTAA